VASGDGWVGVDLAQVRDQSAVIEWRAWHDRCRVDVDVYEVALEVISTEIGMADLEERLMAKSWFTRSDWPGSCWRGDEQVRLVLRLFRSRVREAVASLDDADALVAEALTVPVFVLDGPVVLPAPRSAVGGR